MCAYVRARLNVSIRGLEYDDEADNDGSHQRPSPDFDEAARIVLVTIASPTFLNAGHL